MSVQGVRVAKISVCKWIEPNVCTGCQSSKNKCVCVHCTGCQSSKKMRVKCGASTKRPLLRTSLPYITVLVCVIPCIIYS